jgi:uncharacterized membrane protein YfcA
VDQAINTSTATAHTDRETTLLIWLVPLFAVVALVYASVGFGGGSTYTALLKLVGVHFKLIPVISLLCNIVVVTGGTIRFYRAKQYEWGKVLPLLAVSAPLAYLGGLYPLKQSAFLLILGFSLLLSSIALLIPTERMNQRRLPQSVLLALSGAVGLLAGLSGIGGGIFMSPVLHMIRWSDARRISAFASIYILINSVAGITGQLVKGGPASFAGPLAEYWPLLLAVLVGGQIGSHMGVKILPVGILRGLTALLVGYVALTILYKVFA